MEVLTLSDAIRVEHLKYEYPGVEDTPGVRVFEDLSLEIEEGSFVAVLGSNGCGKSTLAKHFNAIFLPSGGKVYVSGMDTSDEEKLIAIRRCTGMVFQNDPSIRVSNGRWHRRAASGQTPGQAVPAHRQRICRHDRHQKPHPLRKTQQKVPDRWCRN